MAIIMLIAIIYYTDCQIKRKIRRETWISYLISKAKIINKKLNRNPNNMIIINKILKIKIYLFNNKTI